MWLQQILEAKQVRNVLYTPLGVHFVLYTPLGVHFVLYTPLGVHFVHLSTHITNTSWKQHSRHLAQLKLNGDNKNVRYIQLNRDK